MSKKVLVPIADGTEEIEAVCIIDTLRRAEANVTVASVGKQTVTASRGVKIQADALIADCTGIIYDLIALPGGMPGAEHLRDCAPLINMLREQKKQGRFYAAVCASPAVVFAHHHLIDDKSATCYPSMQEKLPYPVADRTVVIDGNCITSQGPATALPFAVKLVEVLYGQQKAADVAAAMLLEV